MDMSFGAAVPAFPVPPEPPAIPGKHDAALAQIASAIQFREDCLECTSTAISATSVTLVRLRQELNDSIIEIQQLTATAALLREDN